MTLIMSYGVRRSGGDYGPKPVETGKEYEVEVTELSRKGDGVARVKGFVIFVKGARIGEKAKIRVVNVGERFATAEKVIADIDAQSPNETTTSHEPKQVAPPVSEEDKPNLQDYKSDVEEEEQPPNG
jgi:predicted RNA-binding protein with TRAM domain